jgi:hypothetical protein
MKGSFALAALAVLLSCSPPPLAPREPGDPRRPPPSNEARSRGPRKAHAAPERSTHVAPANAKNAVEPAKAASPEPRARMAALAHFAYVYKKPAAKGLALGYIRMGTSVPLKSTTKVEGEGCARGWYAVEPRGYVCLNPRTTTLDLDDPYFRALAERAPLEEAVWHYSYAFSNGAPMYSRVPTDEEAEKHEKRFGPRRSFVQLAEWSHGHEELITNDPIVATHPVPPIFAEGKRTVSGLVRSTAHLVWRVIPNGSMVAYAQAFEQNGRVWLVTPDLMLVPADRVRALRRSTFRGVPLDERVKLPLAWNRAKTPKALHRRDGDAFVPVIDAFPAKSWVAVTGERVQHAGRTFLPVRGKVNEFVEESDVTVSTARAGKLPHGVGPGDKWIEVKILPGTLTAYVGGTPVMATLFSPGKGGVPVPGKDPNVYATTAIGTFPIEWKEHVATMSSEKFGEPKVLWFTDVPHIQYLRAPLAMHVSFWHEDFGNPKSAECVNVSPTDGRWLFEWTDPVLPEGWGAIRPGDGNGKSTPVIVTAR